MERRINLGKSIRIQGELIGSEDLTLDCEISGQITLKDHHLTISEHGRVDADVRARGVIVAGKLAGNITADDKVEVTATGSMQGDIRAPRVVLIEGARFKGSVDMDPGNSANRANDSTAKKDAPAEAGPGADRSSTMPARRVKSGAR